MVSERKKLRTQLWFKKMASYKYLTRSRAATNQPGDTAIEVGELSPSKHGNGSSNPICNNQPTIIGNVHEISQKAEAKRIATALQWKHLCDTNNQLIQKNPDARCSQVPRDVRRAVERKQVRSLATRDNYFMMDPKYYHEPLKLLLTAEEAHEHIEMRRYDQKRKRVRVSGTRSALGETLYEYDLIGISKGQPKLIVGDTVILDNGREPERCSITKVDGDTILFKRESRGASRIDFVNGVFDISFVPSGSSFDRYIKNLDEIHGSSLFEQMLFKDQLNEQSNPQPKINLDATSQSHLLARLSKCNDAQQQAIKNMIEATCRPNLYILFGPPGTGKTFTIVETVIQICHRNPSAKILISSSSNNCVDDLALFVHGTNQLDKIVRLSSIIHFDSLEEIPIYMTKDVKKASKFRVVFATNMMASKLKTEFDYIFVDEAGHSHVPETMLPMAKLKGDGCFILAGDPKQLGPVIKSYEVGKLGLGVSLLERMFKFKIYARRKKLGYNPKFITKLTDSYRCDPRILNLCSKLFYNNELKCLGRTPPSLLRILKCSSPLVFVETKGQEDSPGRSTSRQNINEADVCLNYLFHLYMMGVSPDQVGIITPYLLQKELLNEKLKKKLMTNRASLNDRFRVGVPKKKEDATPTSIQIPATTRGLNKQEDLNNLDFITRTLNQLKLGVQMKQDSKTDEDKHPVKSIDWNCKIDTVDAFQGEEREIIIISTVRTPGRSRTIPNSGHLVDPKRFNVAISRAKWMVIVVGHPSVLECKFWNEFAKHSCKSKLRH